MYVYIFLDIMSQFLEKCLSQLAFDEPSQTVLSLLVRESALGFRELQRRSALPRSSLYAALSRLQRDGIIARAGAGRKSLYSVRSPSSFVEHIQAKYAALRSQESAAINLSQLLVERSRGVSTELQLQYRHTRRDVETYLFQRLPVWRSALANGDNTWWGYQDDQFVSQYSRWLQHAWLTSPPGERVCLLSNASAQAQEAKRKVRGRTILSVPKGFLFSTTTWIVGEYLVLISTRTKPHYLVELCDGLFSSSQRDSYKLLWHLLTDDSE